MRADDGHHYVVKFRNNPLGPRVLVNEVIGSHVLHALGIRTPQIAFIQIPESLAAADPQIGIMRGARTERPVHGPHFGSALPCDPVRTSIYDFVPTAIAADIENSDDFVGCLLCDLWLGNTDLRQAVYFRSVRSRWQAVFIDNGLCFAGSDWSLYNPTALRVGPEQRHCLQDVSEDDCLPWLEKIRNLPDMFFSDLAEQIPAEWLRADDEVELRKLLLQLRRERDWLQHRVSPALAYAKRSRPPRPLRVPRIRPSSLGVTQIDLKVGTPAASI
jgi:hypothetical protein